jgi:hypothetical protein
MTQSISSMQDWGVEIPDSFKATMTTLMKTIANSVLPEFQSVMNSLIGDVSSAGFWDTLVEAMSGVTQTVEEMASEFMSTLNGASGFNNAISAFVDNSRVLEDAGYYFMDVAGGWQQLGEEWARIQAYFKVTEMINSFAQAADMMRKYGVTIPDSFETTMFSLMQVMSTVVLPDFQNVIDELMDNIGSQDFWDALAQGMSEAQITQSNSIVLAPYIVISERADSEEIVQTVHDALVAEAKRAGFTWGGG